MREDMDQDVLCCMMNKNTLLNCENGSPIKDSSAYKKQLCYNMSK